MAIVNGKRKVIINTDPGIDDAIAVLMAFQTPHLEIIGLTTTFGNTSTRVATFNCLHLCELASQKQIPVAEGDHEGLRGDPVFIADFIHGKDGLGNTNPSTPVGKPETQNAVDFIIESVAKFPGQVSIVELGPLTNIARAIEKDPQFVKNVDEIWVMGGSFFASGNVNPAAEFNVLSDPEAADIVFGSGAKVFIVGLNVTTQTVLKEAGMAEIRAKGKYGKYISDISAFYFQSNKKFGHLNEGMYLHDPSCMAAFLRPSLFHFQPAAVRVETTGVCRGLTLMDQGLKRWNGPNPWVGIPTCQVAMEVDAEGVISFVTELLCK